MRACRRAAALGRTAVQPPTALRRPARAAGGGRHPPPSGTAKYVRVMGKAHDMPWRGIMRCGQPRTAAGTAGAVSGRRGTAAGGQVAMVEGSQAAIGRRRHEKIFKILFLAGNGGKPPGCDLRGQMAGRRARRVICSASGVGSDADRNRPQGCASCRRARTVATARPRPAGLLAGAGLRGKTRGGRRAAEGLRPVRRFCVPAEQGYINDSWLKSTSPGSPRETPGSERFRSREALCRILPCRLGRVSAPRECASSSCSPASRRRPFSI